MGNKEIARLAIERTMTVRQALAMGRLYMQERRAWSSYRSQINHLRRCHAIHIYRYGKPPNSLQ